MHLGAVGIIIPWINLLVVWNNRRGGGFKRDVNTFIMWCFLLLLFTRWLHETNAEYSWIQCFNDWQVKTHLVTDIISPSLSLISWSCSLPPAPTSLWSLIGAATTCTPATVEQRWRGGTIKAWHGSLFSVWAARLWCCWAFFFSPFIAVVVSRGAFILWWTCFWAGPCGFLYSVCCCVSC